MKRILCLLCALALAACLLAACGKSDPPPPPGGDPTTAAGNNPGGDGGDAVDLQSKSDVELKFSNYRITFDFDSGGEKNSMTEMRCDEGYALISGDSVTFVDFGKNLLYILSAADKTGMATPLGDGDAYKSFGMIAGGFLFGYDAYRDAGLKKVGSDTVIGRKATVYSIKWFSVEYKFWVDNEYGITLKSSITADGETQTSEITELKVGGIKLSDMVNLSEYEIFDMSSISSFLP